MIEAAPILAVNFGVVCAAFITLWAICQLLKDVTLVDSYWAIGMVVVALSTYLQTDQTDGFGERRLLLCGLSGLWGLRLGGYLFWRWLDHGPDRRYRSLLGRAESKQGWSFAKASLLLVFAIQAPLQFIISLPVQLGQIGIAPAKLGPLAWTGVAVALIGIVFETIGDVQLTIFRKNPANQGMVLNKGLWRYTRHPNYFGDACAWWGIYLVAAETPTGIWSLPAPLLLTWMLMKWSGAPTLERRMRKTKPEYLAYVESTSGFVPWPPKNSAV